MKVIQFGLMAVLAIAATGRTQAKTTDAQKEMGTVIGIDLGTTYSW